MDRRADERPQAAPVAEVAYLPRILRNMAEICEAMGVGAKVVRRWAAAGAPIALEGSGTTLRYSAEAARLQRWREEQKKAGQSLPRPESVDNVNATGNQEPVAVLPRRKTTDFRAFPPGG